MFGAEVFDDFRSRCGNVAENTWYAGFFDEVINDTWRKAVGVSGKRLVENDAGHLPVARRCVFAVRTRRTTTVRTLRVFRWGNALQRSDVSQTVAAQVWQMHLTGSKHVSESVRTSVAP